MNSPLAWPYPTLFAHRGGGLLAPENTLAAMKTGQDHGYKAFEFDVNLSRDGVALLMHDETLERTTNGRGPVADRDIADLEKLDAGAWFSPAFAGEPVPHFTAIARFLHGHGLMANVEIKPSPGREGETGRMVAELCVELWKDRLVKPLLSSFSVESLRAARVVAPAMPMGLLADKAGMNLLPLLKELACVSMHCHHASINADLVRAFHAEGYRVMTYTVNDPGRLAELLAMGVDGVFTDAIDVMAKHFTAELADAGRPMRDQVELDLSWMGAVPPMP